MVTNRRLVSKESADFYISPFWSTIAFVHCEPLSGTILDCCCGAGHMSVVLARAYPKRVIASDLHDRGFGRPHVDFLKTERYKKRVGNVVINPPFNLAEEFLDKALSISQNKVCMLLRLAFLEGSERYHTFQKRPPTRVWVFSERLSMYKGSLKGLKEDGGTTAFAWFVWDKTIPASDFTEIRWIPPGFKPIKIRARKRPIPPPFRFSRNFALTRAFAKPFIL